MKTVDRLILLLLASGVWAFVLQPNTLTARDNIHHICDGSGTGHGNDSGNEVYVYQLNLEIDCIHY